MFIFQPCPLGRDWANSGSVFDRDRANTDEFKLQIYVRIVQLLLEEEDAVTAESYFNRATLIIHSCQDKATQRQFTHSAIAFKSSRMLTNTKLKWLTSSRMLEF